MDKKLTEILLSQKVLNKEQLLECLKYQKARGGQLTDALLGTGVFPDEEYLTNFLAKLFEKKALTIEDMELQGSLVEIIPPDIAQKYTIIALFKTARFLLIAISDPKNLFVLDAVKFLTGSSIKPVVIPAEEIQQAIKQYYVAEEEPVEDIIGDLNDENFEIVESEEDDEPDDISTQVSDAPVVKLVNHLLMEAVRSGTSDIHIEPYEKIFRVRYRVDGSLIEKSTLPFRLKSAIISRIKIMADLDISEKRLPQDGRIKIKVGLHTIDIRVNTLPTIYGEKVVMRILDSSNLVVSLEKLGIPEQSMKFVTDGIHSPFGMFLVTGPTGSGKTTTLYTALSLLNKPDINIMTAEDPVEYNVDGINQVNVRSDIGLTFASALRAFLRQDPDVVMVGEIRDFETVEIAIKAALTGHLVFSTLHTNNSVATIIRMLDMGVEPFLVATSVRIIVAQRLIRKICPHCKEEIEKKPEFQSILNITNEEFESITFYKGRGCAQCNQNGYRGRCGLYEVLPITPQMQELIIKRATLMEMRSQGKNDGMITLKECAVEKLKEGITTIEEVIGTVEK